MKYPCTNRNPTHPFSRRPRSFSATGKRATLRPSAPPIARGRRPRKNERNAGTFPVRSGIGLVVSFDSTVDGVSGLRPIDTVNLFEDRGRGFGDRLRRTPSFGNRRKKGGFGGCPGNVGNVTGEAHWREVWLDD